MLKSDKCTRGTQEKRRRFKRENDVSNCLILRELLLSLREGTGHKRLISTVL